jgi:hypothetical protein
MFSFLKDHWVDNYSEESEEEDGEREREEIYTRKPSPSSSFGSELPSIRPSSISQDASSDSLPTYTTSSSSTTVSQERIKELEEQNSKLISQISDLQRIITTKSSLYLEYKEKYEVLHTHLPLDLSLTPHSILPLLV